MEEYCYFFDHVDLRDQLAKGRLGCMDGRWRLEGLCAMFIMHIRRCAARGFLSLSWIIISLLA
jgi:hypothetical protein